MLTRRSHLHDPHSSQWALVTVVARMAGYTLPGYMLYTHHQLHTRGAVCGCGCSGADDHACAVAEHNAVEADSNPAGVASLALRCCPSWLVANIMR